MCVTGQSNSELTRELNEIHENQFSQTFTTVDLNQVLLSTAIVLVQDKDKNWVKCTALLDSGSQSNLISKSLCEKLKLNCQNINIPLSGINQIKTNINNRTSAKLKSRFENFETELQFLVLSRITEKLPLIKFEKTQLNIPHNINSADEQFNIPKPIDMLLGAGIFFDLLKHGKIKLENNQPVLQETSLGWVITGNLLLNENNISLKICNLSTKVTNQQLNETLKKFWQIEEVEIKVPLSKNDHYCEEYFKLTTTRKDNGTFVVKYPFKQDTNEQLGDSKNFAIKRFKNLENRFSKCESLKTQYVQFMQEYETLGHMSFHDTLNNDISIANQSYFLPHSAVLRDTAITTKCRVVFDASAKTTTNVSFNDLILSGPTIQPDLVSILLRLRLRTYVLGADIKMMFRCIEIEPSEREFQKIIWRENPEDPLKVYKLNSVTYGTASAPFQATRCLNELAIINQNRYPRTSKIIRQCFYMDDLLTSLDSREEALEVYHELTEILTSANFELRKWSSNDMEILNYILKNSNSDDENLVLCQKEKELKTLGIRWDTNLDELKYCININLNENKITKRNILSVISQIFDPLGLIGPAMIKAKLIMQQLWHLQLDWDSEIPTDLKNSWISFSSELQFLNQIRIKRHVLIPDSREIELIGFCDSSEKAYGACVYIASITKTENNIKLLTAKSRVAPLKVQSLPRLELLAAALLSELVFKIKNTLDVKISKITYFTDSTIVLSWLKIEPCNLKTFVANRIIRITEVSDINEWNHVKTKDNAADIISRGLSPKELVENKIWFNGPEFLKNRTYTDVEKLPKIDFENLPETKTLSFLAREQNPDFDIFQKYSSFSKLLNIVAYIFRFKTCCLNKTKPLSKNLTIEELNYAEQKLIFLAQSQAFEQEITELKKCNAVNKQSKILNLNPFLDKQGILRVGGRLSKSCLNINQKHPIILPNKHKLTDLIITNQHLKNLHAGTQNLLSIIRLTYWPINGKNLVKRIIKSCIKCYKINPKPCKFLMGDLPSTRVNPSRPFTNCGVDYAGPIYIKDGTLRRSKLIKTYFAVFVCFSTKATHIELATDLTTSSFLNVLKRFCSRRGKPLNIYSDNGLNFVGANNHFAELHKLLNDPKHDNAIAKYLREDKIHWHFCPARSPHMGGLWEAAVRSTKFHLKRVLGESSLSFEEMYTLLVQIEALLNSRPLTPLSNDPSDFLSLTPAHFLIGNSLTGPPEEDVSEVKITRLNRYYRQQQLRQQFWQRWSKDYLTQLQTRTKWKQDVGDVLKVDTLVILVEGNTPPLKWPTARVVELHRGSNNVVRVVTVKLPNGTLLKRAINKVCVLPIETEPCDEKLY